LWKVVGITALVAVLAISAVAVVSAQGTQAGQGNQGVNLWDRMHEAMAKALGITVEQYDSAVDTARDDVLKQAVKEGLLTQEQAARMRERGLDGFRSWGMMRGGKFGGRGFGMGGSENSLVAVAAEELGMTAEQLVDELEAGKTIADVAKAKGVELKTIVDAFIAPRAEYLAELVADGRITQAQADEMLAHMREEAEEHLEESYPFSCDKECDQYMSEGLGGCGRWGGTSGNVAPNRFPGMMGRRTF
jgi:polyhydroxyalkanoate synthesis regulator phasin